MGQGKYTVGLMVTHHPRN